MRFDRFHLYLCAGFFLLGVVYGLFAYQNHWYPTTIFRMLTAPRSGPPPANKPDNTDQKSSVDGRWKTQVKSGTGSKKTGELQGLGYLQGYEEAGGYKGVVKYDTTSSYPGLNLFVSGQSPEALLMDMEGTILHRWQIPWNEAFPGIPVEKLNNTDRTNYFRKFHVFPNGDIIVNFEWLGLVKLDRHSNVIWRNFNRAHHDIWVGETGRIYTLTANLERVTVNGRTKERVVDYVEILSPDGETLKQISLLKAIKQSNYSAVLDFADRRRRKLLHTNTLEILTKDYPSLGPAFSRGNALLSMRNTNTVALLDLDQEKIVWVMAGPFEGQHDPTILENGTLLVFDNWGHHGRSKVIEIDPRTQEILWGYYGTQANDFASKCCGTNQRLPNGNTLITDTSHGRAFEVTRNGEVVWEFYNPYRVGKNDRLVASLYALKRYSRSFFGNWIDDGGKNGG